MQGTIKNIGGSTFIKLPKDKAKELNLIEGTMLEVEIKKKNINFLWGKGKETELSAKDFKEQLKKENFWG